MKLIFNLSLPALNEGGRISILCPIFPAFLHVLSCPVSNFGASLRIALKLKSWNWSPGLSMQLTEKIRVLGNLSVPTERSPLAK